MVSMRLLFYTLIFFPLIVLAQESKQGLEPFIWKYGRVVHGRLWVPPGFKEETRNYKEGIVTYLRYADSSYIMLQHGGMFRVPMFDEPEYNLQATAEAAIEQKQFQRQSQWSESLAAGRLAFVEAIQNQLGPRARGRDILPAETGCQLRESEAAYRGQFEGKKGGLSLKNTRYWDLSFQPSTL